MDSFCSTSESVLVRKPSEALAVSTNSKGEVALKDCWNAAVTVLHYYIFTVFLSTLKISDIQ